MGQRIPFLPQSPVVIRSYLWLMACRAVHVVPALSSHFNTLLSLAYHGEIAVCELARRNYDDSVSAILRDVWRCTLKQPKLDNP